MDIITSLNWKEDGSGVSLFLTSIPVSVYRPWQEHKIQLPHIHKCHLLDYQSQLQSILLSHCHYSLHVGSGHEVTYDLPALEKHILDRFIHGKPTILVDIPHVSYRKDVYTAATFAVVRKKVAKQVSNHIQLADSLDISKNVMNTFTF